MTQKQNKPVVANELIGFQKGEFLNDVSDIIKDTRNQLVESGAKRDDILADCAARLSGSIKKHTRITAICFIKKNNSFNAFARYASLLPTNPHFNDGAFSANKIRAKQRLGENDSFVSRFGRNKVSGSVDVVNSKVYGDFETIEFVIEVNSAVIEDRHFNERTSAFAVVHEVGHIFNQIAGIAETAVLSFNLAEAFAKLVKAKPGEFKTIIDYTAKAVNFKNPVVVTEACQAQDGLTSFSVLAPAMIKEQISALSANDPYQNYTGNSMELAADSFAIRHGGYKEFLQVRAIFADTFYQKHNGLYFATTAIAAHLLRISFSHLGKMALVAAGVGAGPMLIANYLIGHVTSTCLAIVFGTPIKDLLTSKTTRITSMKDYSEFLKREISERAKEYQLSKEDLDAMNEVLSMADTIIMSDNTNEPFFIRFLDVLFNRSSNPKAVKEYANSISNLISNQLFVKAQELNQQ